MSRTISANVQTQTNASTSTLPKTETYGTISAGMNALQIATTLCFSCIIKVTTSFYWPSSANFSTAIGTSEQGDQLIDFILVNETSSTYNLTNSPNTFNIADYTYLTRTLMPGEIITYRFQKMIDQYCVYLLSDINTTSTTGTGDGATGARGATGPGKYGASGSSGSSGATGATGIQGYNQPQGATGSTGIRGSTGASGATGPSEPGSTGLPGRIGVLGTTGLNGTSGFNGTTGFNGATGFSQQGAIGSTGLGGATGSTGLNGATGFSPQGQIGATGVTSLDIGATGLQGSTGIKYNGATGFPGTIGLPGSTGATGLPGLIGVDFVGATGATGSQGSTGASGATGLPGYTSYGIRGETGLRIGSQGATGATGINIKGATGSSGMIQTRYPLEIINNTLRIDPSQSPFSTHILPDGLSVYFGSFYIYNLLESNFNSINNPLLDGSYLLLNPTIWPSYYEYVSFVKYSLLNSTILINATSNSTYKLCIPNNLIIDGVNIGQIVYYVKSFYYYSCTIQIYYVTEADWVNGVFTLPTTTGPWVSGQSSKDPTSIPLNVNQLYVINNGTGNPSITGPTLII